MAPARAVARVSHLWAAMVVVAVVATAAAAAGIGIGATDEQHVAVDETQYLLTRDLDRRGRRPRHLRRARRPPVDPVRRPSSRPSRPRCSPTAARSARTIRCSRCCSPLPVGRRRLGRRQDRPRGAGRVARGADAVGRGPPSRGPCSGPRRSGSGWPSASAPLAVYGQQVYPELPAARGRDGRGRRADRSRGPAAARDPLVALVARPWLSVKYVPVVAALAVLGAVRWWRAGRHGDVLLAAAAVLAAAGAVYLVVHRACGAAGRCTPAGDHFTSRGEFAVVGDAVEPGGAGDCA